MRESVLLVPRFRPEEAIGYRAKRPFDRSRTLAKRSGPALLRKVAVLGWFQGSGTEAGEMGPLQ